MYLGGIDFLSMKSLSTTFPPHWKTASHALPGNHFIVTRIHPEILHYLNLGCHLTKVSIANWQRLKERVKIHICPCVQRKGKSIHCNALHYHITTFLSSPGALYMTNRPIEQLTLRNWRVAATNHCQTPIPCKYTWSDYWCKWNAVPSINSLFCKVAWPKAKREICGNSQFAKMQILTFGSIQSNWGLRINTI